VDTLEKKVEEASAELGLYKKKCEHLAKENSALIDQVGYDPYFFGNFTKKLDSTLKNCVFTSFARFCSWAPFMKQFTKKRLSFVMKNRKMNKV
jgi:hypothetical protein